MKLNFEQLEVAVKDAYLLDPEEFTNIRRQGIGASDSSVILGLQKQWKTTEDIIEEKLRTHVTEEEKEIGRKISVRKGRDLEPLILDKASEFFKEKIIKPTDMYRLKHIPYLTVNFDGVMKYNTEYPIPVEAKFVTTYGEKYYNVDNAIKNKRDKDLKYQLEIKNSFIDQDVEVKAKAVGIPPYYYAQVQQQLLALDAPYGYLVALHDKTWELSVHLVPADPMVQFEIIRKGKEVWDEIEARR